MRKNVNTLLWKIKNFYSFHFICVTIFMEAIKVIETRQLNYLN